jgi:hydrogenase expression/formation protein HypD
MAGLRKALPAGVELIPGPGCPVCICPEEDLFEAIQLALNEDIILVAFGDSCPVCICPEEDLFEAIQLALNEDIILVAFGDMLRVPVNVKKCAARSLEQAKAQGADIRPLASPTEAVKIARENPSTPVVFFAAGGFETTSAPVAAMLVEGVPDNLFILLSGRLTWPAVAMLLESGEAGFDALVAPGHVATVMGPEELR